MERDKTIQFVDYVDLLPGSKPKRSTEADRQRCKDFADRFKIVAQEQGIQLVTIKGDEQ